MRVRSHHCHATMQSIVPASMNATTKAMPDLNPVNLGTVAKLPVRETIRQATGVVFHLWCLVRKIVINPLIVVAYCPDLRLNLGQHSDPFSCSINLIRDFWRTRSKQTAVFRDFRAVKNVAIQNNGIRFDGLCNLTEGSPHQARLFVPDVSVATDKNRFDFKFWNDRVCVCPGLKRAVMLINLLDQFWVFKLGLMKTVLESSSGNLSHAGCHTHRTRCIPLSDCFF